MSKDSDDRREDFEKALRDAGSRKKKKYVLRLYVSGVTPRSTRAIANIKKICEEHLKGRYELEVIDLYQQPGLAKDEQVIAAPTLVKKLPLPLRRFIGDLSDTEKILVGLELIAKDQQDEEEPKDRTTEPNEEDK
jgi:circadian clock protein KaiB